jgi:hypothetical protein
MSINGADGPIRDVRQPLIIEHEEEKHGDSKFNNKLLKVGNDVYMIPCKTKLLVKRIKSVDMNAGIVTTNYTQLVWINLKGFPTEIYEKFKPENLNLKYRLGF